MFDFDAFNRGRIAHGLLMALAVIVFFPLGGVLIRLLKNPSTVKIHIALQVIGLAVLIAGFGLGLWVQDQINIVYSDTHQKLGTVLVLLLVLMPIAGAYNHWRFKRTGQKTMIGTGHVWIGRILTALSIIDGGFGLKLAKEGTGGKVAYAVLAAFAGIVYAAVMAWWYLRGRKASATIETAVVEMDDRTDPKP